MAAFTSPAFALSVILLLFSISEAKDYYVGDTADAWRIPTKTNALNGWAELNRFEIGDSLVWNFTNGDSALEVGEEGYVKCDTGHPKAQYQGDKNKALLDENGTFYYISGIQGHCQMGQKLNITVGDATDESHSPSVSPVLEEHAAALESSKVSALAPTGKAMQAALLLFTLGMLSTIRVF